MNPITQQKKDQALREAIASGNIEAIELAMVSGANPGLLSDNPFLSGEQRLPAFFWSVMHGNLQVIRLCLKAGFDPNELDGQGQNALFYVPNSPEGHLVWEELVAFGLNPHQPSRDGSVAWSKYPKAPHPKLSKKKEELQGKVSAKKEDEYAHLRKTPRPTLGPTRRTIDDDDD